MKHIQKDYKVTMYIHREFSANQNVVFVGERNDEDHAVPSVMKLNEKLTDEEGDEMILETDVDGSSLTCQFFRSTEESWKLSQHSTGANSRMSGHTDRQHVRIHTKWWRRSLNILDLPQQVANAQDAKIVSRRDPAVNQ